MILFWGARGDSPLDAAWEALPRDANATFLDQRDDLKIANSSDGIATAITYQGEEIPLTQFGSAYIRPQESSAASASTDIAMLAWADFAQARIVNRPAAMATNYSKPTQLAMIMQYGFDIPDTLVTTDAREVRAFWSEQGEIVYKSISGIRSIVSRLHANDTERLADVVNAPTQFQEYVPGDDIRVHVIGERIHATRIRCEADDYRYASLQGFGVEMTEEQLPRDVARRCLEMVLGMGLNFAGIDLRERGDGSWVCLEVNPSPAYIYYELGTGQPISVAVAEFLERSDDEVSRGL